MIIGGGIAGLVAAHALAARFARVTVLERDRHPGKSGEANTIAPPSRRGAPQSRCLHLLLAAGAAAFDELLPGWRDELVALGATPFDPSADAALRLSSGWLPRMRSGITAYACSRSLLENVLRRGLASKSTVHLQQGRKVRGLVGSPRGDTVIGVHTPALRAADDTTLLADLVVDASGAGSALPRWIAQLLSHGASQIKKTVVESGQQYVSRWFTIAPNHAPDWHCLSIAPAAGAAFRSAMMLRAEGDRWGVVLLAPAGQPLPCDDTTFQDFVARIGDGELHAALAHATPVSPIHRHGPTSSRMMHYDGLTDWPAGLVAIGDSVCALDPYSGLGMTAAARGAVLLGTYLDERRGARAGVDFQRRLAALNAEPWRLATGCELDGRPLARDPLRLRRLVAAAPSRPDIAHAFLAVQHLLRPADSLEEVAA